MKKLLILFFLLFTINATAQELITNYDENSLPVLNEVLRLENESRRVAEARITVVESEVTPLSRGGTETALTVPTADASIYWDYSAEEMAFEYVTFDSYSSHQIFTSSGTFTVPAGIYLLFVTIQGGGGGGGYARHTGASAGRGGGGGAGAVAVDIPYPVTPGQEISVTVGTGGLGGIYGTRASTDGEASVFGTITADYGNRGIDSDSTDGTGGTGGTIVGTLNTNGDGSVSTGGLRVYPDYGLIDGGDGATGTGDDGGGGGGTIFGAGGDGNPNGSAAHGDGEDGIGDGSGGGGGSTGSPAAPREGGDGKAGIVIAGW